MSAIRIVTFKATKKPPSLHLLCHVKPGASTKREGILSISDSEISLCVSEEARDGKANKAVTEMIARVLGVPKSDVEVAKGQKSREKTILVNNFDLKGESEEKSMNKLRDILKRAGQK